MSVRRVAASAGDPGGTMMVRLIPGYQPRTEVEQHVYAALADGPLPLPTLIERVAEQIIRAEVRIGGWMIDAGVWGPFVFRSQVAKLVETLNGSMLVAVPGKEILGDIPKPPP